MRLIDADKLDLWTALRPYCSVDVCCDVTDIIDNAPTINPYEWISVEDDTPKKNGYYLCWHMTSKCGNKEEWQISKLYWEDNLWLYHHNTFKTADYVTHWMCLPVPPGHIRVNVKDIADDKFGFWTLKENDNDKREADI